LDIARSRERRVADRKADAGVVDHAVESGSGQPRLDLCKRRGDRVIKGDVERHAPQPPGADGERELAVGLILDALRRRSRSAHRGAARLRRRCHSTHRG
jgi:hypothetical protein